jgi:hypothetical protein
VLVGALVVFLGVDLVVDLSLVAIDDPFRKRTPCAPAHWSRTAR